MPDEFRSDAKADERKTLSVPEAGKIYYGIGRVKSYEAAASGDIPTIRIGRLLRVPRVAMERKFAKLVEAAGT